MFLAASVAASLIAVVPASAATDLGHQTLTTNDGWAAATTGTTGGIKADSSHVFTVTNRAQLVTALGGDNSKNASNSTAKIINISGTINMNVDDNNKTLGLSNYADPAYDFNKYLAAYDPSVWGTSKVPSGTLESARVKSQKNQGARVQINVGPNTTIVGSGTNAKIVGGNLMVQNVDNVIIRNIEFQDAYDYFPQWDPTDGSSGNWNSQYDSITLKGATHVWIDHCTFDDGSHPDSQNGTYFGREYQHHDGTVDITNASDYVTVSYNYFHDHDKTTLLGGSDSATGDSGHLRVTFHHNYYQNIVQRAPRVRYGQVHIYNNYYEGSKSASSYSFSYAWGIGINSKIYAQNNVFNITGASTANLGSVFSGTQLYDTGSQLNGSNVTVSSAFGLSTSVGWTPSLYGTIDSTSNVKSNVTSSAGAGKIQ
nr:pectate lyase [Paenibacillus sp. 1_12]